MGAAGTPAAMETADVVLFSNDLGKLAEAARLGRRCRAAILQNVAFAIALKAAMIVVTLLGSSGPSRHPHGRGFVIGYIGTIVFLSVVS